jgi:hypothetical protein
MCPHTLRMETLMLTRVEWGLGLVLCVETIEMVGGGSRGGYVNLLGCRPIPLPNNKVYTLHTTLQINVELS